MNNNFVIDTMAFVLRLEKRKISRKIITIFEEAERNNSYLFIPAMVLAEIGYLAERNRIDTNLKEVIKYCKQHPSIQIEPVTEDIIHKNFEIDRQSLFAFQR